MKGKGLILTFAIALGILSIYYLSFTWYTNIIESKADRELVQRMDSLDSAAPDLSFVERESYQNTFKNSIISRLASDTLDLGVVRYDYNSAKEKEMALGLDLKGGMNVILQISVRDLIEDFSDHSASPALKDILDRTDEAQKSSNADYINDFFAQYDKYKAEKESNLLLASPDLFGNRKNAELISINSTDNEVKEILDKHITDKINTAFQVIRARIDQFGVTQPNVQKVGEAGSGRILVELPGVKDTDRVKNLLQSTAKLEFWEALRLDEQLSNYATNLSQRLMNPQDSAAQSNSLISKLIPSQTNATFFVQLKDTAEVNKAFSSKLGKELLPAGLKNVKFLWGNKTFRNRGGQETDFLPLYAIKGNARNMALLDGGAVTDASAETLTQTFGNDIMVSMQMNSNGGREWYEITKKYQNKPIAIVLDNLVYSAPNINEPISGGRSSISGDFTMAEAQDLASVLSAGSLPASAKIIQVDVVGPSLGKQSIQNGIFSFLIALVIVFAYMIFFYNQAGIISVIGLIVNILFLLGILVAFGATLTLPGIAGIVLTIGMAVDANVIVYERIKEEMAKGKSLRPSVDIAYTWKGALSAIIDANITTLITAIVLFYFGNGPIKGFAVTLIIGVFTTFFTSVLLCMYFIYRRLENGGNIKLGNKWSLNFLKNTNLDFFKFKKISYIISGTLVIISLISLFTRGLNLGIEFQNGREYKVRFNQPIQSNEIASDLAKVFIDEEGNSYQPNVVSIGAGTSNQVKITTKYKSNDDSQEVDQEIEEKIYEGLKSYFTDLNFDQFVNVGESKEGAYGLIEYRKVGPSIADDITYNSFYSLAIALSLVFLYLILSFKRWQFSAGAVLATMHDSLIVLGLFSLLHGFVPFSLEIDVAFIAAILTVIGYSLNDSVIVFDRVREFLKEFPSMSLKDLINKAINTTLTRTLNTSMTTLFVILVILILGGETIRSFMFALAVGVGVGTYSSVFVASYLFYDLMDKKNKK